MMNGSCPSLATLAAAVVFLLPAVPEARAEPRTWKQASSGHSLVGELQDVEGRHVVLAVGDRTVRLPVDRLDRESQAVVLAFTRARATEEEKKAAPFRWEEDLAAAARRAADEEKILLLHFTGSDWCFWCDKLDREVFSTEAFQAWARVHAVLVEVDFPEVKELSETLRQQNADLQRRHGVTHYPTIVLTDPEGGLLGRTGYRAGGGERYVRHLRELLAGPAAADR